MFHRILKPSQKSSFFLFGARGAGKSTFLKSQFLSKLPENSYVYIDLLDDSTEDRLMRRPQALVEQLQEMESPPQWVIIDEIQKVPKLLDLVHQQIEKKKYQFILSGSSARKLKIAGANLLAGRAFEYRLFPLHSWELGKKFSLEHYLQFGGLPSIYHFENNADKNKYLAAYSHLYLKMEIQMEQLLRKLEPFRFFLEIAAQMNGKILNYTKISKEVGVDTKTIQNYYQILEETWLGFSLPAFHHSLRKSQRTAPKFYLIDPGIKRALENSLHMNPAKGTSFYGESFEHFVILEFYKLNHYCETQYRLSYLQTREGGEIDLILSRANEIILIEIKSSSRIDDHEVNRLNKYAKELNAKAFYLSQDPMPQKRNNVQCLPWNLGLEKVFGGKG
jgi:predicted AAA+ superfamily ATPase